jgi:hypothetical protein
MCIYEISAFPDIFLRGNTQKKYVDVADRACRQNFADIVGCRRHVADMSPTCATKVVNEVQEAIVKGKDFSYKIKLPIKTKFSVPIWDTGTQKAFLIHVQQAKSTCKRKGLC